MPADKNKPFYQDYLAYLLARASDKVSNGFHAQLKAKGVPVSTWRILAVLSDSDGMTINQLCDLVMYQQPTLSKQLDRLEAEGQIKKQFDQNDRRRVLVHITRQGRTLVESLLADAKTHEDQVLAEYNSEERKRLKALLSTLIERNSN